MNLGTLSTIAWYAPKNLIHIVFDNQSLLSVGGFPTATGAVTDLAGIAQKAGFRNVATARTLDEFEMAWSTAQKRQELCFILVKVEAAGPKTFLMDLPLLENRFEFQRWLKQ
jgi:sulfopyruvate decarboxylase subunit beta